MDIPDWENRNKLWLNPTHYIRWVTYTDDSIIGGILGHTLVGNEFPKDWCEGAFYFKGNQFTRDHPRVGSEWEFNGNLDKPTLSPSLLCHCKLCHCYIREGQIVDAGCKH